MGEVKAFRRSGRFPKHALVELANDPELAAVQIICHWKGDEKNPSGFTTVSWTPGLTHSTMLFGARHMMLSVDQMVLGIKNDDDY